MQALLSMANPFDEPEMRARLVDLLDARVSEANSLLGLVYGSPMHAGALTYLDALSAFRDLVHAGPAHPERPAVAGVLNADLISSTAEDRTS